jgi:hypothetical protein
MRILQSMCLEKDPQNDHRKANPDKGSNEDF